MGSGLHVAHVSKTYPGVVALDDVSLDFLAGEVHALVGKNGAGKSTLLKIISGATLPDRGTLFLNDREIRLTSPLDALRNGIATVYQELSLVPELTVAENLFLGHLPRKWRGLVINRRELYERAQEALLRLKVSSIDVGQKVSELSMPSRQLVEIAKAVAANPSVLLLDEPTSALSREESLQLFVIVRCLAEQGVAIIYVSHRLQELDEIADRVSVLRDGRVAGTTHISNASPERIAEMMFGYKKHPGAVFENKARGKVALEIRQLTRKGVFENVNLQLYEGEVLGIAGMMGSGRTELLRAISGVDRADSGEIVVYGKEIRRPSPVVLKKAGVGLVPENRKEEGIISGLSIRENICLSSLCRWAVLGIISRKKQKAITQQQVSRLEIGAHDVEQIVGTLSGGNQQKVVLGRWLAADTRVMLLDEPTRGIDVQAKSQVFEIIREMRQRGVAIIFVSSELEELVEVCDRIAVMHSGKILRIVSIEEVSLDRLLAWCLAPIEEAART